MRPIPGLDVPVVDPQAGRMKQGWFDYFQYIDSAFKSLLAAFTALDADSASFLTTAGHQNLTGGFTSTEFDNGTPINGASITINPSNGLKQKITNNVASFTIVATAECGDVELRIINGVSAGTVTPSGFYHLHAGGDALNTTNTNQFIMFIYGYGAAGADYLFRKRQ